MQEQARSEARSHELEPADDEFEADPVDDEGEAFIDEDVT